MKSGRAFLMASNPSLIPASTFAIQDDGLFDLLNLLPAKLIRPDSATMGEILHSFLPPGKAKPVQDLLENYIAACHEHITGFKAGSVKLLNDEESWPIVEWREGQDTEVLGMFKVADQGVPCDCLFHYGTGKDPKRWRQSVLSWQVSDTAHLAALFGVAQHVLGMLHWSEDNVVNMFLGAIPSEHTPEK